MSSRRHVLSTRQILKSEPLQARVHAAYMAFFTGPKSMEHAIFAGDVFDLSAPISRWHSEKYMPCPISP